MSKTNDETTGAPRSLDGLVRFYYRITKREGLCPGCGRPTWGNVNFNKDGSPYMYCYRPECGYAPGYKPNAEVSFRACEINSTDMFGVSVARVDGFRSQPTVNTDEDMVRVVLDMPKGTWRKLKSIIPPNDEITGASGASEC